MLPRVEVLSDVLREVDNTWLDTAGASAFVHLVRHIGNTIGWERVLFGSDYYGKGRGGTAALMRHQLDLCGLSEERLLDVFQRNLTGLLGQPPKPGDVASQHSPRSLGNGEDTCDTQPVGFGAHAPLTPTSPLGRCYRTGRGFDTTAACSSSSSAKSSATTAAPSAGGGTATSAAGAPSGSTLYIAGVFDLSGAFGHYGQVALQGVQAAVNVITAAWSERPQTGDQVD